jgi:TonB family protein
MTALAQALSAALLHFIWQGTLVAFLLWIVLSMLRKRTANQRYAVSCAALALMAALPALTAWMVYRQVSAVPISAAISTAAAASITTAAPASIRAAIPGAARIALGSGPLEWMAVWRQWALPVWSAGVLVFALRLVLSCRHVAALRRLGDAAEGQIAETVALLARRMKAECHIRVLISTMAESPSVVGWLRPAILLPAATLAGLEPEQLRAVLAHEIAHIRRHDYLVNLAQTLVETLLFYHPAVWWASARIRHERELCCDDAAVAVCGDAISYARALTSLERLRAATPRLALGSTGGSLLYRIQRLAGVRQEMGPSKLPGIAALALGLACFAATVHWAKAQTGQMVQQPQMREEWGVTVSATGGLLHRNRVAYPESAYKNGIEGTVTVEATLDQAGNVADARVWSGPPELRKAALESVLQWRFANGNAGDTRQVSLAFQPGARRQAEENRAVAITRDGKTYLEPQGNVEFQGALGRFDGELQAANKERGDAEANQAAQINRLHATIAELELRNSQLEAAAAMFKQGGQEQDQQGIEAQLAQLEARAAELQVRNRALEEERSRIEQDGQEQGNQVRENQAQAMRQLAELLRTRSTEQNPETAAVEAQLEALRKQTEYASFAGARLARIEINGLPESAKAELGARLSIRLGEALSTESMETAMAAIHGFDQRLVCRFVHSNDGGVALQIIAPEQRK